MKKVGVFIGIISLIVVGILVFGKQEQEIEPEYVLTYAENHLGNYPTIKGAEKFTELVKEKTNGRIVIQVKKNGEYGTQKQEVQQLVFGGIDFTRVSISSLTDELPALNVLQLPFFYENAQHMWSILDSEIGDSYLKLLELEDMIGLSWYDAGARSFYSSEKPITSIEDMQGMTVRVQECELMKEMMVCLGANPVDMAMQDIYSAFETGEIDAAENNWPTYAYTEHYEVAKYYTVDEHTRVPEVQLMSKRTWDKLSEEDQKIILECAKESAAYERALWEVTEKTSRQDALKNGCEEVKISEEELAKFRQAMEPLYAKYTTKASETGNWLTKEMERLKMK